MGLFRQAMEYYPYVVHPITVVGICVIALIYYEWRQQLDDRAPLRPRVLGFLGAGVLALVPTVAYFLFTGRGVIGSTKGNSWEMDALVASGLLIAAGGTWYSWRREEWGSLVPHAMVTLAAVTVPYVALSPFWNVSGHVMIALMPTLYLTLVDRRFWPTLLAPAVMVPNRIVLDAHTWAQTIGGFVIAFVVVVALFRLRGDEVPSIDGRPSTL